MNVNNGSTWNALVSVSLRMIIGFVQYVKYSLSLTYLVYLYFHLYLGKKKYNNNYAVIFISLIDQETENIWEGKYHLEIWHPPAKYPGIWYTYRQGVPNILELVLAWICMQEPLYHNYANKMYDPI